MMNTVVEQLKMLIQEELGIPLNLDNLDETTTLLDDGLELDSIAFVELIVLIEQHFNFLFSEAEINLDSFKTIGSLSTLITKKLEALEMSR